MFSLSATFVKPNGEKPDEFESSISQALLGMNSHFKAQLQELNWTNNTNQRNWNWWLLKAMIIFVLVPQLKSFQKTQVQLVCKLEKLSGKHIVFIILPKSTQQSRTRNKQKSPRNWTLTTMHNTILGSWFTQVKLWVR